MVDRSEAPDGKIPRPSLARRLFALHGWLGLGLGLVLAIICGSGALAVFGTEIDWLLQPALRVEPQAARASFSTLQASVLEAFPGAKVTWWEIQPGPRFADSVEITPSPQEGAEAGHPTRVYVNPYTGAVQGVSGYLRARTLLRAFHYYWYDTATGWGFYLVAAFALVLLGSTLTGMAIFRRWWRGLFALRWGRGRRIFFSDLHKLCGAWTLVFNLVIALTAVYYLIEAIAGKAWEIETPRLSAARMTEISAAQPPLAPLALDQQVENARRHFPELRIANISFPDAPDAPLYFDGQATAWLVRERANKLLLDPYDGSLVFQQKAEKLSPGWRWIDTVDGLHFGNFGGIASKIVWCILGLMLPVLFLTGAWLAFRRAGSWSHMVHRLRNPLNACGLLATGALLLFATLSTVHGIREALKEKPMLPKVPASPERQKSGSPPAPASSSIPRFPRVSSFFQLGSFPV